jgi:hypothetical protein
VFILAAASWGADPREALSARPKASFYWAARMDDLGGTLRSILTPANIEMFTSLAGPEEAQEIRLMANFASQVPAKSIAFIVGSETDKDQIFVQIAISLPEQMQSKLDLVAQGKAKGEELATLLLGDAALLFAGELGALTVREGPEGPYYILDEGQKESPILAAKDNLLLISLSPADLKASLAAIEKAENRLAFKRRFESSNYSLMYIDVAKIADFIPEDPDIDMRGLKTYFKEPLEVEVAFDAKPGKFLISSSVNVLKSLENPERWKTMEPAPGAGMFLAGGGKLLFGVSSIYAFEAKEWKIYPEFAKAWGKLLGELEKRGITEKDIENLLTGTVSLVIGGESVILGKQAPGFYIALNGREGAAAKIWSKILEDEAFSQAIPLSPLKAEGWDSLFMVDPALVPASLLLGTSKDMFFLGALDPKKLGEKPKLAPDAAELFKKDLFVSGFLDLAATWEYLKKEVSDPSSHLGNLYAHALKNEAGLAESVKNLMDSELAISSIKVWGPDLETGFTELTFVDVPEEKQLLPKLVNLAAAAQVQSSNNAQAASIVKDLHSLQAAGLMFFLENEEVGGDDLIDLESNAGELLKEYLDDPEAYAEYIVKITKSSNDEKKWLVGCSVSGEPAEIKQRLQARAESDGLVDENGNLYSGGDVVFMMIAR